MSDEVPRGAPTPEQRAHEFAEAAATGTSEQGGIDRRSFIGFVTGLTGGLAAGGLAGIGIGHWLADQEDDVVIATPQPSDDVAIVTPPTEGADTLIFYPRVKVADLADLEEGTPIPFEYPLVGQRAQLVKLGKPAQYGLGADADIVAFSTICTHMGWPLDGTFDPATCVFGPCPGHFTTFDAAVGGQVTLGQATQRLPQIVLAIEGDAIYAEGVLGLIYGYRQNLLDGTPVEVQT